MTPLDPQPPADLDPEEQELLRRLGRARTASCPDPALLQAEREEVLPEETARAVRGHLATCAACRALAENLSRWEAPDLSGHEQERLWRRIQKEAGGTAARPPAAARRWMWPALAAALFVALVPAYLLVTAPPSPAPSGPPPTSVAPDGPFLSADPLPVLVPPGGGLVWRDGGADFDSELRAALVPYAAGDFADAARRLEALAAKYPRAPAPALYLGVSQLRRERPREAVRALEAALARAGPFWIPHVQWYLAVAAERTGDRARAGALLRELCGGASVYAARACAAAPRLDGAR